MKVYVHIATEYEYMDPDVSIAVNCSAAPRKGECFHLCQNDLDRLGKAIIDGGFHKVRAYGYWVYGPAGRYYLLLEDCIFVGDSCWKPSADGYSYHIALNNTEDRDPNRECAKITEEDYRQIRERFYRDIEVDEED